MNFWDKVSSLYDLFHISNRSVNDQIAKAAEHEIPQGANVLDCAAGTGLLTFAAAKNARHVTCTDASAKMLRQCVIKAKKLGVRNVSFAKRDIFNLKEPDEKYDAVMAGNVLHLLSDPEKAFAELLRVTKKGGIIILPTYLQAETKFYRVWIKLYELFGFDHKTDFTMDSYLKFISDIAEKHQCAEYSTRYLHGNLPAGFAVIRKD